jgi:hypothetical protein
MVDNKVSSWRLLTSLVFALHPMTHKQRYVYLAIMYSIYGGVAEYPVTIDLAVDCCARMIYII